MPSPLDIEIEIESLLKDLDQVKPTCILESLELFENQLTLNQMKQCFLTEELDISSVGLLLSERWERIRGSSMCYTQKPSNPVNQLCLKIAKKISPPAATEGEIEALKPNAGPYCLLMPSLVNSKDVYGDNIHSLGPHEFVLSDGQLVFIPVAQCLDDASVSDRGQLRHMVAIDGHQQPFDLTSSEVKRVSHHSKQAGKLHNSILALNHQKLLGDDVGSKLMQLANALRGGGAHSFGQGSGTEFNAGSQANIGIAVFSEYWKALSLEQQSSIFTEQPNLKDLLSRLFLPDEATEVRFCVELIANGLDPIIRAFLSKTTTELNAVVQKDISAFNTALHDGSLQIIQNNKPPNQIFQKMNQQEQQALAREYGPAILVHYVIQHQPEGLHLLKLSADSIQEALNDDHHDLFMYLVKNKQPDFLEILLSHSSASSKEKTFQNKMDAMLTLASTKGHIQTVACLLTHGAQLAQDGNTALTAAIKNKHANVVGLILDARFDEKPTASQTHLDDALCCAAEHADIYTLTLLLGKGANPNAQDKTGNTALTSSGHRGITKQLLMGGADVQIRNKAGENALDIATRASPFLLEPILVHLATQSLTTQKECLTRFSNGLYHTVFSYVAVAEQRIPLDSLFQAARVPEGIKGILNQVVGIYESLTWQKLPSYEAASNSAKSFVMASMDALAQFSKTDYKEDGPVQFKTALETAICSVEPVLSRHRGGFDLGFFGKKTSSALSLIELKKEIDIQLGHLGSPNASKP